jgi:hypothetical protein
MLDFELDYSSTYVIGWLLFEQGGDHGFNDAGELVLDVGIVELPPHLILLILH